MMKEKTDLEEVKKVARILLHLNIHETQYSPIVVDHPIFESGFVNTINGISNILTDETAYNYATHDIEIKIFKCKDAYDVYSIFRTAYKLTFIKFAYQYLSVDDMSLLLSNAWVTEENPNQDSNVSVATATRWFKKANKRVLMTEDDYAVYESLEDEFTVYRGVAVGRNPKGLSWTKNLEKAEWFANRFNNGDKVGYVQAATARKENVLAYFNTRGEDEIVINVKDLVDVRRL